MTTEAIDLDDLEAFAAGARGARVLIGKKRLAALVAAVKAAQDFMDVQGDDTRDLSWHEAFNVLDEALHPFVCRDKEN